MWVKQVEWIVKVIEMFSDGAKLIEGEGHSERNRTSNGAKK